MRLAWQVERGIVACVHFKVEFGDLIMALTAIAGAVWATLHFHTILVAARPCDCPASANNIVAGTTTAY